MNRLDKLSPREEAFINHWAGKPQLEVWAVWLDEGKEVDRLQRLFLHREEALDFIGHGKQSLSMYVEQIDVM